VSLLSVSFCVMLPHMVSSDAVRALRNSLGESQQAFANRCGLSISSVTHYEGGQRTPDYWVTLTLYRVACEAGRKDLATFFLGQINTRQVAVPFPMEDLQALQAIQYDARFQHLRGPLEDLLAPVKAYLKKTAKRRQKGK